MTWEKMTMKMIRTHTPNVCLVIFHILMMLMSDQFGIDETSKDECFNGCVKLFQFWL